MYELIDHKLAALNSSSLTDEQKIVLLLSLLDILPAVSKAESRHIRLSLCGLRLDIKSDILDIYFVLLLIAYGDQTLFYEPLYLNLSGRQLHRLVESLNAATKIADIDYQHKYSGGQAMVQFMPVALEDAMFIVGGGIDDDPPPLIELSRPSRITGGLDGPNPVRKKLFGLF